jgi:hypothetical protein
MVGLWKKDQESCGMHAKARVLVPKGRVLRSHAPAECLQQGNLAFRDAIRPKTMRTHPNMCPIGPGPTRLAARQMLLPSERSCFPKEACNSCPLQRLRCVDERHSEHGQRFSCLCGPCPSSRSWARLHVCTCAERYMGTIARQLVESKVVRGRVRRVRRR